MEDRSRRTGYSRTMLDRAAERRNDPDWLAAAWPEARFLLFAGDRPLFRIAGNPAPSPIFGIEDAKRFQADPERAVLLGRDATGAIFAAPVPEPPTDAEGEIARGAEDRRSDRDTTEETIKLIDVRSVAVQGLVSPELLGPIAQAKSMLDWHARHGFCASCGAPTQMREAGYRRKCESCGASHFPRTDPVVIMLAIDGDDCFLARAPRFQPGMYSALAGFIEPGETIEDAVRREVGEETAIQVDRVAYHSSQPWPFPASLMIGCFARALGRDVVLDRSEIEEGRWFSREEVAELLGRRHPDGLFAPPEMAIAHQLMKSYVAGETIF